MPAYIFFLPKNRYPQENPDTKNKKSQKPLSAEKIKEKSQAISSQIFPQKPQITPILSIKSIFERTDRFGKPDTTTVPACAGGVRYPAERPAHEKEYCMGYKQL